MGRLPWFWKRGGDDMSPDPFKEALEEIRSFEYLKENWDSDGARPIHERVRNRAERFLTDTRTVAQPPDVLAAAADGPSPRTR